MGKSEDVDRWLHPLSNERYACRRFSTLYFSGTAYAFRRDAVMAAGLFPEILFMHYEEVGDWLIGSWIMAAPFSMSGVAGDSSRALSFAAQ